MNFKQASPFLKISCGFLLITSVIYIGYSRFMGVQAENPASFSISTIHGDATITDPLVIELINCPAMQRLKKIRQYGTTDYVLKHTVDYNRFEHSLGVYHILCKHGASRAEQVAGLLHDISHTVFSHACDPLFMGGFTQGAYQDSIHEQFLAQHGIKEILAKYSLTIDDVSPKQDTFRALEQDAPALCADRIEYNIFAAHMDNLLSPEDIKHIQNDLHFDGHDWYFETIESAKKFALIPMHQTMYMWSSPLSILVGNWTCEALKRALALGLMTKEDICFGITDDEMWQKLKESTDPEIQKIMNNIAQCNALFSWASSDTIAHDDANVITLKAKFRGVDPLVKTTKGLELLSTLDPEFKHDYETAQNIMRNGWNIVLHKEPIDHNAALNKAHDPRLACKGIQPLQENNSAYLA